MKAVVFLLLLAASAMAAPPLLSKALWIKHPSASESWELRASVELPAEPESASLAITADNGYELFLNGARVGADTSGSDAWRGVETYDVRLRLTRGANFIGIHATNSGGARGVVAALQITFKDRPQLLLVTNGKWRTTGRAETADYSHPEYVEGPEWTGAIVAGRMGDAPWGDLSGTKSAPATARHQPPPIALTPPSADFRWPAGVVFVGDDCSTYVPRRGEAWGVVFRVGDWTRAYTEFDLPCPSKIGRKLFALAPGPGAVPRVLFDAGPKGVLGSPCVTFDGRAVLVALAREGDPFFHIHRIPLDGGPPQALTHGPYHDIDPAELPDGRIVFTSTRIGSWEEYHQPPARALFTMNADGSAIRPITFTPIFDNEPKVAADGSIVFIRSDNFFDRAKVETQLHMIRPDGTRGVTVAGANVGAEYGVRLRRFGYGSPAPLPDGRLAFLSNRGNFVATPGAPESAAHRLPDGLGDLAALPDGRLLATVLRPGVEGAVSDVLAVIDPRDNKVVPIHQTPGVSMHSPVFLGMRERPPVLADFVEPDSARPGATGFLLCENARFTTKTQAGWENVRAIRVLGARPVTVRSSHSHIVHIGHESVELGTVPLAPDGSFHIEVPADMPLALQAVDAEGRSELNEMSWIYVRPGEQRSCTGCHQPRETAPAGLGNRLDALLAPPLKTLGQGAPHRFRGNNPGVTGMMDLQFDRFRENASLNLHAESVAALVERLQSPDAAARISAVQRLGALRDRAAAPSLAAALGDKDREVRVAAALALAACGTRDSLPALLDALGDGDSAVASAAAVALENLTGHARPFSAAASRNERVRSAAGWREWLAANPWPALEQTLIAQLGSAATRRRAAVALGHIGGEAASVALRRFVAETAQVNPYPVFEKHNRTDRFTFSADSPLNPRTLQEAVRALGHLKDPESVQFLASLAKKNFDPRTGNLFLAEASLEALGQVGSPAAESALLTAFASLREYWEYDGWFSDHKALYACHSSPLHARILHALDASGTAKAALIVPHLLRSVPTDPDRALFLENDDYETLVGRVIARSGRAREVIETCLALLGDESAKPIEEIRAAIVATHRAWAGTPGPENRAAQVLSFVCRERGFEPRVRAAFERFRARPEEPIERQLGHITWTPVRHWTLFFLGRTLGNLGDPASTDALVAVLDDSLNEARHGRPDPAHPAIHLLHNDYTPCWRAAAAWALGRIGEHRATSALLRVVRNFDNAPDVRHAAATALARMRDPAAMPGLRELAVDYPDVLTQRVFAAAVQEPTIAAEARAIIPTSK